MKGAGMLVVSFRGVNFGFWSHLGCSTPLYLTMKVSLRVARSHVIFTLKHHHFQVTDPCTVFFLNF